MDDVDRKTFAKLLSEQLRNGYNDDARPGRHADNVIVGDGAQGDGYRFDVYADGVAVAEVIIRPVAERKQASSVFEKRRMLVLTLFLEGKDLDGIVRELEGRHIRIARETIQRWIAEAQQRKAAELEPHRARVLKLFLTGMDVTGIHKIMDSDGVFLNRETIQRWVDEGYQAKPAGTTMAAQNARSRRVARATDAARDAQIAAGYILGDLADGHPSLHQCAVLAQTVTSLGGLLAALEAVDEMTAIYTAEGSR